MGRKSTNRSGSENGKPATKASSAENANRSKLSQLCSELLELCSLPPKSGNTAAILDDYRAVEGFVRQIVERQVDNAPRFAPDRLERLPKFMEWCSNQGVCFTGVEVVWFAELGGFGLRATRALSANEPIIHVPRSAILCTDYALQQYRQLFRSDPLLCGMPNVAVAFLLLLEKMQGARSPWRPYIDILPPSFDTAPYFSSEELLLLKGSAAFEDVYRLFRNVARQYAYFFGQICAGGFMSSYVELTSEGPKRRSSLVPIPAVLNPDNFTFEAYRWATSAVMTRLNFIPEHPPLHPNSNRLLEGSATVPALIPLWDLANHRHGQISTDFDVQLQEGVCYAQTAYEAGQQVYIYYGPRSTADFLTSNGFVELAYRQPQAASRNPPVEDDEDGRFVRLRLGLSKSDKLLSEKQLLLAAHSHASAANQHSSSSMCSSEEFEVRSRSPHFSAEMLLFVRVFLAQDEDQLAEIEQLQSEQGIQLATAKVWRFVEQRLRLVMSQYSSAEQLEAVAASSAAGDSSSCRRQQLAAQLCLSELELLGRALSFASDKATASD